MENFKNFLHKAHLLIGFDFYGRYEGSQRISRFLAALKYSNLAILIIATVQMLIYMILTDTSDPLFMGNILLVIVSMQGITKTIMEMKNLGKIKNFMDRIEKFYIDDLGGSTHAKSRKFDQSYIKVMSTYYICNNLAPILQIASALMQWIQSPTVSREIFIYGFYFPFDRFEYLPWTLFYSSLVLSSVLRSCILLDQVAICKTIMLSNCFNKLADDVKEVIDGAEESDIFETKKKLAKCIAMHNQLIEFCEELNETYKYLFATCGFTDAFVVAIVGYQSAVRELFYLMIAPMPLLKTLLLYYPGQKLTQSSLRISEELASSEYVKLQPSLQKHLILMTLMSQKRLGIHAFGLVHFDLKGFSKLVNSAYTYVAFLKTIYS